MRLFPLFFSVFFNVALYQLPGTVFAKTETMKRQSELIYEKPTMVELSKLFWSLDAVDVQKDPHIDNYILINECDIYKEFRNNEFEWRHIREATRDYLKDHYKEFPRRIEFMQPLYLEEYNFDTNSFKIVDEYVKPNSRRMEVLTKKHMANVCNVFGELSGYPKGLIVELTRPFGLSEIPVKRSKAKEYINAKLKEFNKLPEHQRNKKRLKTSRDAYVWMQVRVFGLNETVRMTEGYFLNSVFAVLEGLEVYSDRERRNLLYRKEYDFYGAPSDFEKKLRDQYQALLNNEKANKESLQDQEKGIGLLHIAERIMNEKKKQ